MFRDFSLRIGVLAVVTGLGAASSQAANSDGARVTQVQKDVSSAGAPLEQGGTAAAGTPVVTGANSRAELKLANGTTVRIGQGSHFSFDGANLSLTQGSALFKLGGGKAKIATPSINCAASAGVISAHSGKNYEACFVMEGAAVINGVGLKTGEGYVRENGNARKIAFDVKRMLETSFLVTKFPKTPWVVEAFAVAAIQSELLAANRAQSALLSGRAPVNAGAAAAGKNRTPSALVASAAQSSQNTGSGASAVASNVGSGVSGATLSFGSGSGSHIRTGAGTLNLGTSNTYSGGSGGSLSVGGASSAVSVGASLTALIPVHVSEVPLNVITISGNPSTSVSAGTVNPNAGILTVVPGAVVNTGNIYTNNGVLTVNGANTGVINLNAGSLHTITTANGGVITFGNGLPFTAASPSLKK